MKKNDANVSDTANVKQLVSEFDNSPYADIIELIEETRFNVAQTVNTGIVVLYWNIGEKINDDVLRNKRADTEPFPYFNNVVSLIRQLSWTNFIALIPINVAEYITEILPKELSHKNAHTHYVEGKNLIVDRG